MFLRIEIDGFFLVGYKKKGLYKFVLEVIFNIGFVFRGGVNGELEGWSEIGVVRFFKNVIKVFFNIYDFVFDLDLGM